MSKETKKEFIDTVKIIRKGEPGWWDYEKDAKMIENSIRDEARDIGHQEGYKSGIKAVARKMKESGQTNEYIKEVTGLSTKEIEKL